jgi:signal transduction histidine kinase
MQILFIIVQKFFLPLGNSTLWFLVVLCATTGFSQTNKIDSVLQQLDAKELSVEQKARLYGALPYLAFNMPVDTHLMIADNILAFANHEEIDSLVFIAHNMRALGLARQYEIPKAIEIFLANLDFINQQNGPEWDVRYNKTLINLANSFAMQNNLQEALKYARMVNKRLEDSPSEVLADNYWQLGVIFRKLNEADSSMVYHQKAIDFYKTKPPSLSLGKLYRIKADLHNDLNQKKKALQLYNQAIEVFSNLPESIDQKLGLIKSVFKLLLEKEDYNAALDQVYSLKKSSAIQSDSIQTTAFYFSMYKFFSAREQYDSALYYYQKHTDLYRTISNQETIKQSQELERKFQLTTMEKEKELLRSNNQIQRYSLYFLTGLVIFSFVIIGILFFFFRRIRIQKEKVKAAKEELEKVTEIKNNLVSLLIHDLRSPLAQIRNTIPLLRHPSLEESRKEAFSKQIQNATQRIDELSFEVIKIQQNQNNSKSFNLEKICLNAFFPKLVDALRQNLDADIRFDSECAPGTDLVYTDPLILQEVFNNLIINAFQHNNSDLPIQVKTYCQDGSVITVIVDQGGGIDQSKLSALLFAPVQLPDSSTLDIGLGIGLRLSRKTIEAIGGQLIIQSEKGIGTTVMIKFASIEA